MVPVEQAQLRRHSPVSLPGMDHFLYGLSDELKQAHREQLFAVHRQGLIDVSDK